MHIVKPLPAIVHRLAKSRGGKQDTCPAAVYLGTLTPGNGRRLMALALNQFAAIVTDGAVTEAAGLDWSQIAFEHTSKARAVWTRRYLPAGAKARLSAVKSCLRVAWRMGQLDFEQLHRALDLAPIRGTTLERGRALTARELDLLFGACTADLSWHGRRDAALFAVFRSGLRLAELQSLALSDYLPAHDGEPAALRIQGKGGKERWGYLPESLSAVIDVWLAIRGGAPGPLICPLGRWTKVQIKALSERSIIAAFSKRAAACGVAHFSPHDMRRTTATELQDNGEVITVIRDVLGHSSVKTTERYIRNDRERAKRRAAVRLRGPGGKHEQTGT